MHLGHQHKMFNKKTPRLSLRSIFAVATLDTFAYVASFLSIIFTFDQVRIIYLQHDVEGISLISWLFYTFSSIIWFTYGRVHRERILIITNGAWFIINVSVVVGILIYGAH
jgi:uncharacterized protein with PQ loop repeat